jgi:DmsE family decaheme c-type cytochrome
VRSGQDRPVIPVFGPASAASVEQQNGMCLACHTPDVQHGWAGSAHEREGVACVSCHEVHAAHDRVLSKLTQAETCMGCHPQQRAQSQLPFAHPVRQERVICSDCHEPHGALADFALVGRTLNDTCFSCHADKRGPYLWEHAPVSEDCSLCHEPHGSNHRALLTQRPPLLCQQCHSEAGHPSVPLSGTQLPSGTPSSQALGRGCMNCHSKVHGSNHPSGAALMR